MSSQCCAKSWAYRLRTIVVTGDTSSAIKQLPGDPHVRIMSKPIDSEELMTAIRSLAASLTSQPLLALHPSPGYSIYNLDCSGL